MTYRVDEMAFLTDYKSDIELASHTQGMGDITYNTYDVINSVCAMTYKQWCVVSQRGCDAI